MSFHVLLSPEAQDDIRLAAKWYNKQQPGLGKEFIKQIRECRKVLKTNPYFIKRYKQVHTIPLQQFPFMLHFLIDKPNLTVTIIAVLHTSLNPETNWK